MKNYILFIFILIFFGQLVYAGTRHTSVDDSSLLLNAKSYDCVAQIIVDKPDGEYKASCVIISEDTALTSAHIINNENIENIYILYHNRKFKITKYYINQNFKDKFDGDIAIIKILGYINTKYPELYEDSDEINKIVYLGGYGFTGTGLTGIKSYDFKLRIGTNKVEYISGDMLMCTLSQSDITEYEFITTQGDSGGGLFINNKLAGINSSLFGSKKGEKPTGKYNNTSGHTRISVYIKWIKEHI